MCKSEATHKGWSRFIILGESMKGIQFVSNDRGQKVAVQINLQKYGEIWEDFYDSLIARSRAKEPRESLESVKKSLIKQGKLRG
jgi:hypothetical protein